jgi:hypothetical protein
MFLGPLEADGMGDLISTYGQMRRDGAVFGASIREQGHGLMTEWKRRS